LRGWRQTPDTRVPTDVDAAELIDKVGIATVFECSPEIANLYHAHMGDPEAKTENTWDSPAGRVYSWRWTITKTGRFFYGTVVRKRPTFVAMPVLPAILNLVADLRTPDELFDFGVISADAYRIAQCLDGIDETRNTGEIRKEAGFPTGKDHSARYHKGLAELENRLLITTEFGTEGDGSKRHGLIFERQPSDVTAALAMTTASAVDALLAAYLPSARYAVPSILAKHVRIDESELIAGLDRLTAAGALEMTTAPGIKGTIYTTAAR
jgi:hypothetical protein